MGLIDTHTHLDSFARRGELPAVLERAHAAGLEAMIAIGTEPDDWQLYQEIAGGHPGVVHYTVGLHPCSVGEDWEQAIARMAGFWQRIPASPIGQEVKPGTPAAKRSSPVRPVAVGEVGLDRFHLPKDPIAAERVFGWQRSAFAAGLAVAKRAGVPVVVHSRGAFRECVEMIDASGVDWSRVVFHCFSEGVGEMDALNRRGGRGSFTGIITYTNADEVRAAARAQGLGRLMVETDAPYLAPGPYRGKRNEPCYVVETARVLAETRGVSPDEIARATTENFFRLFNKVPRTLADAA